MNRPLALCKTLAILCFMALQAAAQNSVLAEEEMTRGVAAHKVRRYGQAAAHFRKALDLDPELPTARLYLATALANQYIPGASSDENVQLGQQALLTFREVLDRDPNNLGAISGSASLSFQMQRMDDAKQFYSRHLSLEPQNPEPYYSIAVIDWKLTYQRRMLLKTRLQLKPQDPISDRNERETLRTYNAVLVDEGIAMLEKAMLLRPDYDDAMAYMNLRYRERADLAGSPEERERDLAAADLWMDKSLEIKKVKDLSRMPAGNPANSPR